MTTDKPNSLWLIVAFLFLLVIIASSIYVWLRRDNGQAIEISQPSPSAPVRQASAPPASAQKIDINKAEAWLLEALPEIGATRAQDIIAYRNRHGPFAAIEDVLNVPGITSSTFQKIKDLISVAE